MKIHELLGSNLHICDNKSKIWLNRIFACLPSITVGVVVIINSFEKDEKLAGRLILLVKRYGVLDSVSTLKW